MNGRWKIAPGQQQITPICEIDKTTRPRIASGSVEWLMEIGCPSLSRLPIKVGYYPVAGKLKSTGLAPSQFKVPTAFTAVVVRRTRLDATVTIHTYDVKVFPQPI